MPQSSPQGWVYGVPRIGCSGTLRDHKWRIEQHRGQIYFSGTGFVIESTANVRFDAPEIILMPGFSVNQGASFVGANQGVCVAPPP